MNGEYSTDTECLNCGSNEYSIFGAVNCTSDCGMFTEYMLECLELTFCKQSFSRCVSINDKTVLIVGLGGGTLGAGVVSAVVVPIVLWRIGWYAKKKREKEIKVAEELELLEFETSALDVNVTPNVLAFGGRVIAENEDVAEVVELKNNGETSVVFGVSTNNNDTVSIQSSKVAGEVKSGESISIEFEARKNVRGDASGSVEVTIVEKKNQSNGKRVELKVVMKGLKENELLMNELMLGEAIGEGTSGVVHKGQYKGKDVAIKRMKKQSSKMKELFLREVDMLKAVQGKNVIKFVGFVNTFTEMCHVTEFMDLGTLHDVFMKNKDVSKELKLHMMKLVAIGMQTIHSFNVIHRDLKPENVLCKSPLGTENPDLCKVTDFGTSRAAENVFAVTMTRGQGTPLFMAPEILGGRKRYSKAVDVYSYGVLCCAIWNDGRTPYSEAHFSTPMEMQNSVIKGLRPELKPGCPLTSLIERCWSKDPTQRPSFDLIVSSFFS